MPLWNGPTADFAMQPDEFLRSALDQPMSLGSTFFDQAAGGVVESFGLGTAIREGMTPDTVDTPNPGETEQDFFRRQMQARGPSSIGQAVGAAAGQLQAALSEDQFKASPYYREGIPYDRGMTSARAQALAEMYDIKKAREFYADKRPITSFIGNILGQATDPINYVPVFGPAARAAAVSRFGTVGGRVLVAGADAAANTAIAGVATTEARNRFGDQIDWEDTVSQSAMAALIGGAFGAVGGVLARRAEGKAEALRREAELRLATLERTQEARAALNDAVQSLAIDGEVRLSPGTVDAVTRVSEAIEKSSIPDEINAPREFGEYINTAEYRKRLVSPYVNEDGSVTSSSRFVPNEGIDIPVGSWRIDDFKGNYGREIEQLRDVDINDLALPELREGGTLDVEKLGDDQRYADWMSEGKEPPPIEVIRREDGTLRVADGHRRVLAAKLAGRSTVKAWVSELVPIPSGRLDANGKPIMTSLTYELAMKAKDSPTPKVLADAAPNPVFGNEPPPMDATPPKATGADPKAIAEQYGVNAETGEFVEQAEVDAMKAEGRMTEDEVAALADADKAVTIGASWGEALKAAVGCLI